MGGSSVVRFIILTILIFVITSCGENDTLYSAEDIKNLGKVQSEYSAEAHSILKNCKAVSLLVKKYPNVSSISYFTSGNNRLWNTKVFIAEKYELHLQFKYDIVGDVITMKKEGFIAQLLEYKRIKILEGGRMSIRYGTNTHFTYDEFMAEFELGFVFKDLIVKGKPVLHASKYFNDLQGIRYKDGEILE